ncbi:putative CRAL/TRIO domain, CRAL-TRIO lipid binding domain superfamily [Helianthus anomalus]
MNPQPSRLNSNGPLTPEDQQKLIIEVREAINKHKSIEKMKENSPNEFSRYCSDASISRYLRARNWNIKKAVKMFEASLIWRMSYKPEEILWEHVAAEGGTGKIYRSSCKDKNGRVVLVLRPRFQVRFAYTLGYFRPVSLFHFEAILFRVNYCFRPCGLSKITISVH